MKKKIIILSGIFVFCLFSVSVLAAFVFHKNINGTASSGNIDLISQNITVRKDTTNDLGITESAYSPYLDEDGNNLDTITCYATKKGGYSDEEDYPYLNQIGASFSFTNTIDVYIRVYFQQAWISHKVYRNGISINTSIKFTTEALTSALADNTNWIYDSQTGYLYLNTIVSPSNLDASGNLIANIYSFNFSKDYYYTTTPTSTYREAIIVDFSYTIDIVQANRASTLWGFDIEEYLRNAQ